MGNRFPVEDNCGMPPGVTFDPPDMVDVDDETFMHAEEFQSRVPFKDILQGKLEVIGAGLGEYPAIIGIRPDEIY